MQIAYYQGLWPIDLPSTYYKICVIPRLSQESRVHISNIHFINKLKKIPLVSMKDASDWVFFTQIYFLKKNLYKPIYT